ncbi:hypothetical protein HK096_000664, partial [Nowakowskiella sp. JEL0078]
MRLIVVVLALFLLSIFADANPLVRRATSTSKTKTTKTTKTSTKTSTTKASVITTTTTTTSQAATTTSGSTSSSICDVTNFGAKTDGTDAAVGINAAFAKCVGAGSTLLIPAGTFTLITKVVLSGKNNYVVSIQGTVVVASRAQGNKNGNNDSQGSGDFMFDISGSGIEIKGAGASSTTAIIDGKGANWSSG